MSRTLSFVVAFIAGSLGLHAQVATSWTARYSGPTNSQDSPRAIAVDSSGNSYVTGVQSEDQSPDIVTIKYNATGARVWTNTWGSAGVDYPTDIEVDAAGGVYVYGSGWFGNFPEVVIIKYSSSGAEQWVRQFGSPLGVHPAQMTIDAAGNIYLTAVAAQNGLAEFITLKYDSSGTLIWSRAYSETGRGFVIGDFSSAVAVNASRQVYVTGASSLQGTTSTFLLKYDTDGTLLWKAPDQPSLPYHPRRIALDDAGNIYVGTTGPTSSNYGLLVFKYNSTGQLLWSGTYRGPSNDSLVDIAVDSSGNVYLTGSSFAAALHDIVTVKFTANGTREWVSRYNNELANSTDDPRAGIATDSAGSIYVAGYTMGGASQHDFLVLKYDANGNQKWAVIHDEAGGADSPYDFAIGPAGTVFLTGSAYYIDTGRDIFTLKLEQTAVSGLPEIIARPNDAEVIVGHGDVTFSVLVQSPTPVTYQWRFNGREIPGATQPSYTVTSPDPAEAGEYSVRVANAVGVTASPEARLTVRRPPAVSIFTAPTNVVEGRTVVINGYPDGDPPIRFQWRFNGADLVGQTNVQLRLTAVTTNNSGSYALIVRNPWGDSISTPVQINVSARGAIDRWTWLSPLPQGNELTDITYGNGRYVAVGVEGTIVVSTNGRDWSVHTAEYGNFSSIAFGKGLFVALADGFLYTSPDGITWTNRLLPTAGRYDIYRVAFGAGRFVGAGNALVSSDDGISWIERGTNASMGYTSALTYGNDIFLIHTSTGMLTSSNGVDWLAQPTGGGFPSLAGGNGVFVAHDYGRLLVSTNGSLSWLPVLVATNNNYFYGVRFANGQFYGLGTKLFTSVDGFNWTERIPEREGGMRLTSAAGGPGQTIVVGDEGLIFASTDGATFTQVGGGTRNNLRSLVYANNRFTLVGNDGVIWNSTDGNNFAEVASPTTNNLRAIAFGNGTYVVVGDAGTVLTSSDAVAWQRLSIVTNDLYGIAFANGHFTVVGDSGRVLVSTNATNWTLAYASADQRFQGIAYGAGRYVATGRLGFYANSTNAVHWNAGRNESVGYLESIVYANGFFLGVGAGGRIFISPDGVQWAQQFTGNGRELESVIYVLGQFIAAGDAGTIMTSTNGTNWVEHRFLTRNSFRQIIYARGALWGVGNNETVVKSGQLQPYLTLGSGPLSGRLVRVVAEPGQVIELQASDNSSTWETLARGPASAEGTFTYIDSAQRSRRFYRVAP